MNTKRYKIEVKIALKAHTEKSGWGDDNYTSQVMSEQIVGFKATTKDLLDKCMDAELTAKTTFINEIRSYINELRDAEIEQIEKDIKKDISDD